MCFAGVNKMTYNSRDLISFLHGSLFPSSIFNTTIDDILRRNQVFCCRFPLFDAWKQLRLMFVFCLYTYNLELYLCHTNTVFLRMARSFFFLAQKYQQCLESHISWSDKMVQTNAERCAKYRNSKGPRS